MNPYGRLHSGNEWSRSPFLIHEDLLVSAAVAGQDEAFVELCRRTSGRALTAIYRITQNRKDAQDVLSGINLHSSSAPEPVQTGLKFLHLVDQNRHQLRSYAASPPAR